MSYRYLIGIDLGTTNSVVAYVDLQQKETAQARPKIQLFPIPQLVKAGEMGVRSMLPSFLYLAGAYDLPAGSLALPWDAKRTYAVGEFAHEQGVRVPGRLVASAKSWLSHAGVDRTSAILPWGAPSEVNKVSPVEASARYLQHIAEAWNAQMAAGDQEARLERQQILLTVPASFDEVARELTLAAAQQAGFEHVVLLEEPLAAFYAWLSVHEADWQSQMQAGQLILVCDVGGGTSDFSIIGVREGQQGLRFDRLAVGDHLMLGGDNIDITLARYLESTRFKQAGKLDALRWQQLVHQCRKAKETLLNTQDAASKADVTIVGSGSQLIGGVLKASLSQPDVQQWVLDGFFPEVSLHEPLQQTRRSGFTELGLPYVQDTAITRHLAAFWRRFQTLLQSETGREQAYPDFLLFNGGALIPALLRNRIQQRVQSWFAPVAGAAWSPIELANPHPEQAVALGAAYYGLVRLGVGIRVGSGSPRAYYIGVETKQAHPPHPIPPQTGEGTVTEYTAVCVAPRGVEDGFAAQVEEPKFTALTNQPVAFQLLSSSTRLGDRLGDVVQLSDDQVTLLPPIRTVLRYGRKGLAQRLPVQLAVYLSEVGVFELWCQSQQSTHRWRLQFDLRQLAVSDTKEEVEVENAPVAASAVDAAVVTAAQEVIQKTFQSGEARKQYPVERLRKALEEITGLSKEEWPTPLIRPLADALLSVPNGRPLSAEHEARWLNLLGYCLRPGLGAPLDDWRIKEAWKPYFQGLHFPRSVQCRTEWWTFWRRIAGGLNATQQAQIYQQARPYLSAQKAVKKAGKPAGPGLLPGEEQEFWMMLANLEWLSVENKVELGRLLLQKLGKDEPKVQELWAFGRLGARIPLYGPIDRLIPAQEVAGWIDTILARKWSSSESLAHTLVSLARLTNDRSRDIPDARRQQVAEWLKSMPNAAHFVELLMNPASEGQQEEQNWLFGDALPSGLVLNVKG